MTAKKDVVPLAGWADIDCRENACAPVLIVTERLLRRCLFYNENFCQTEDTKPVIFIIDCMNDRTVDSDLCLALLALQFHQRLEFQTKIKLIILLKNIDESLTNVWTNLQIQIASAQIKLNGTDGNMHSLHQTQKPRTLFQDIFYFEFLLQKSTAAKKLFERKEYYPNLINESRISKSIEQGKYLGKFLR